MQNISKSNLNSHQSFRYAVISLILLFIIIVSAVVITLFHIKTELYTLILGLIVFAIGFLSIFGFMKSIKALKEPKSTKKTIAILVNSSFLILFLCVIVANILDIYKATN